MDYIPTDFYGVEPPTSPLRGRFKSSPKKQSVGLWSVSILGPMAQTPLVAIGTQEGFGGSFWGTLLNTLEFQWKREWEVLPEFKVPRSMTGDLE